MTTHWSNKKGQAHILFLNVDCPFFISCIMIAASEFQDAGHRYDQAEGFGTDHS